MFNKIILVGNLTRDIELRYSQSGTAIANTAIATTRKFTSNGEKKEEVCFVDITFFGRSGEVANQYLRKGSKILIEGRLNFEQWVDKQNGGNRSKHSVVVETMQMLDSRADSQSGGGNSNYNAPAATQQAQSNQNYGQNSAPQGGGYNKPPQQQYSAPQQQNQQYNAPQQNQAASMPQNSIPTIDIDEDEIPF
ncbi:MAG: single-stranded DNA-binding protein [Helicobacteraceae bacterium]|nr:single-stranded DNA-binding protein [Helicobacteraceae bacterium]